ncbi:MAG: STELLO glycosyltransferase family protein [Planctomycetota bacterium]|jgi:hypothetical protein
MKDKISIVVTSIAAPNEVLCSLSGSCNERDYYFIVIGDQASPAEFHIDGCDFYSLDKQKQLNLKFAVICPTRHYARKNIGYLLAIRDGASIIVETDDDNMPCRSFWTPRERTQNVAFLTEAGWVNVYRYFSDANIWPRGFPLEQLQQSLAPYESLSPAQIDCPIQQGLADDNPDVDAIYRLILPLPQTFRTDRRVALGNGSWCPFNSQNTSWWPDAFELLYLPSYCSFRMTDIWRSFIAQRIAWVNGWSVLFHEPTMTQQRNEHNLLRDLNDEVPGYLHNSKICETLAALQLESGVDKISDNLKTCYQKLVSMSLIGAEELPLLDAWLTDINQLR